MLRRTAFVFALCIFVSCLGACRVSGPTVDNLEEPAVTALPVAAIEQLLPALNELSEDEAVRLTSDVSGTMDGWQGAGNATANAVQNGTAVQLPSGATELSASWYGTGITYNVLYNCAYNAPYDIEIHTNDGGDFWFALADYQDNKWNIHPTTYSGADVPIEIGLEPNAANINGTCWFAIITYGGEDLEVSSIDVSYPDAPAIGDPVDYRVLIQADDGTHLATNVFLPIDYGLPVPPPPYPAILFRTPYDKADLLGTQVEGSPIAQALGGMNVVMIAQYFRGRLNDSGAWPDSEGTETLFREHAGPDFTDAIDTVEWIEARHWYNGELALSGPSALGLWIYQAATQLGDRVAAIYPQVSCGNVGNWAALRNGCFKRSNVEGWLTANGFPPALLTEAEDNFNNSTYWDALDFDAQASGVGCRGYHEVGWWDVDVEATIHSYQEIHANGGVGAAGNQYILIGPWSHDTVRQATVGEVTYPTTAGIHHDPTHVPNDYDGTYATLNSIGRTLGAYDPPTDHARVYFTGANGSTTAPHNRWYNLPDWPPAYSEVEFYLDGGDPSLVDAVGANGNDTWSNNPFDPIPTLGGANLPIPMVADAGPYDQFDVIVGEEALVFQTEQLTEDWSIAGPITCTLFVSTDAADTDIMVKLVDIYPGIEQPVMLVADTGVRLSWYLEQEGLGSVVPGTVYELEIEIGHRAHVFSTSHRIGLVVQSSNYPRFDLNPGNGDPFFDGVGVAQNNTIYFGADNASVLVIPYFDPT